MGTWRRKTPSDGEGCGVEDIPIWGRVRTTRWRRVWSLRLGAGEGTGLGEPESAWWMGAQGNVPRGAGGGVRGHSSEERARKRGRGGWGGPPDQGRQGAGLSLLGPQVRRLLRRVSPRCPAPCPSSPGGRGAWPWLARPPGGTSAPALGPALLAAAGAAP